MEPQEQNTNEVTNEGERQPQGLHQHPVPLRIVFLIAAVVIGLAVAVLISQVLLDKQSGDGVNTENNEQVLETEPPTYDERVKRLDEVMAELDALNEGSTDEVEESSPLEETMAELDAEFGVAESEDQLTTEERAENLDEVMAALEAEAAVE